MYFYSQKKYFSVRVLSFVVLLSMSCSLFPIGDGLGGVQEDNNSIQKELEYKFDVLKLEHVLDSVGFLQDSSSLIDENEWEELEIDNVLENWKKYQKTKFDLWGTKKLLKYAPAGSKEFIRLLVEDDEAFEKLNTIITNLAGSQDALLAYWEQLNVLHRDARGLYYSIFSKILPKINNKLNNSSCMLELSQVLSVAKPVLSLLAFLGVSGTINGYFTAKFFGRPFSWKQSIIQGFKKPVNNHNIFPAVYKDERDCNLSGTSWRGKLKLHDFLVKGTLGDQYVVIKVALKNILRRVFGQGKCINLLSGGISGLFNGGLLAWGDYNSCVGFKNSVKKIGFLHKTAQNLQHSLVTIADLMRSLESLEKLECPGDTPEIIRNIKKYTEAKNIPAALEKLFELLKLPTFESKASYAYRRGALLKTHLLFTHIKNDMIPLLQNIALLGGYRAIAHMIRDHKGSRVGFCFVKPGDSFHGGPMVKMKNAWLPLIGVDQVVTNDVNLGVDKGARDAVITGPNGGGKSTFMLTVAFNVLLSSLGIAAADEAEITDFARIRTSLRPQQDIKSGLSAFMAEHKRVDHVKKDISGCAGNILVLLDEPYKGTVEAESAKRIYEFGKEVAEKKNCMLLLATHLRKPIELPDATDDIFANYQMGYVETKAGPSSGSGFKRTFKVLDGAAIWWFDDADKRARYIDWLCSKGSKD